MKVRKAMVKDISDFVTAKFGPDSHKEWTESLDLVVREVFQTGDFREKWYNAEDYFVEPSKKLCELFYESCPKGAREAGRWGAGHWLKGLRGMIARMFPVSYVIRKFFIPALHYYYGIVDVKIIKMDPGNAVIGVIGLDGTQGFVAERFAGGIEAYLKMKNFEHINVVVEHSRKEHKLYTIFEIMWSR